MRASRLSVCAPGRYWRLGTELFHCPLCSWSSSTGFQCLRGLFTNHSHAFTSGSQICLLGLAPQRGALLQWFLNLRTIRTTPFLPLAISFGVTVQVLLPPAIWPRHSFLWSSWWYLWPGSIKGAVWGFSFCYPACSLFISLKRLLGKLKRNTLLLSSCSDQNSAEEF